VIKLYLKPPTKIYNWQGHATGTAEDNYPYLDAYLEVDDPPERYEIKPYPLTVEDFVKTAREEIEEELKEKREVPEPVVDMEVIREYLWNLKEIGLSNRAIARALFPSFSEAGIAGQISLILSGKRKLSIQTQERWIKRIQKLIKKRTE